MVFIELKSVKRWLFVLFVFLSGCTVQLSEEVSNSYKNGIKEMNENPIICYQFQSKSMLCVTASMIVMPDETCRITAKYPTDYLLTAFNVQTYIQQSDGTYQYGKDYIYPAQVTSDSCLWVGMNDYEKPIFVVFQIEVEQTAQSQIEFLAENIKIEVNRESR